MAVKANLQIDQGSDFSATIDLVDATGAVYNLTGHTIAAQMRKNYASSAAMTFNTSHNSANGQIQLAMTSSNTAVIEPGRYLYDVEIRSSGGAVTRVVEGVITVTPGITRI
jgi:hypothetical protein